MQTTDPVSIRSPCIYAGVLAVTLLTIAVRARDGTSLGPWALAVLFVAVVLTGMPHGAIDHLVAARLWGLDQTWSDQAKFYGGYLALMVLYGAFWLVAPAWSLGLFLVKPCTTSGRPTWRTGTFRPSARLLYLSRGLFLIGLPIVAFPGKVEPIFEAMGGVHLLDWPLVATAPDTLFAGLVAQHVVALGFATLRANPSAPWAIGREALNVVVLAALFGYVHPLVAFSVYFGAWHALGHILELLRFFRRRGEGMSMTEFYREAFLFTALPFVGLAGLYAATQSFGLENQIIALLFILIAIVTLPHMVVVEKMYREREEQPRKTPCRHPGLAR